MNFQIPLKKLLKFIPKQSYNLDVNKMTSSNDMETAVQKLRASLKKALETEQRLEAAVERATVSETRLTMTLAEHAQEAQ